MITRERILAGLMHIVERLGNDPGTPPEGWSPQEWAYVNGIASANLLLLHDKYVVGLEPDDER